MSRSRKKNQFYTLNSHYNVRIGKKFSRRKFRSKSKHLFRTGYLELMPQKMYEVSEICEITDFHIFPFKSPSKDNTTLYNV